MRGGRRDYGQQIEVRCWDSVDARVASPTKLPFETLRTGPPDRGGSARRRQRHVQYRLQAALDDRSGLKDSCLGESAVQPGRFAGIFALMGVAWLLSADRKVILAGRPVGDGPPAPVRPLHLRRPGGGRSFPLREKRHVVVRVLEKRPSAGTRFVFGRLTIPPGTGEAGGEVARLRAGFPDLPTIIFFSSLVVLYCSRRHRPGLMPQLLLRRGLPSPAESASVGAWSVLLPTSWRGEAT